MSRPFSDREWSAIISDFRRSGLTQADFCRRRHISVCAFRYRFYSPGHKLRAHALPSTAPSAPAAASFAPTPDSRFIPVHVRRTPITAADHDPSQPPAPLELVLGSEPLVRIPVGFDPATLRQLLEILQEQP
jgi:hypothetical protein